MKAMVWHGHGEPPRLMEVECPEPGPGDVQVRVLTCGVCRTDLHLLDGDLTAPALPLIPGHQIVGTVSKLGPDASRLQVGDRVGIGWLGGACGACRYCRAERENLCDQPEFTGYTRNGGFAEYTVAHEDYCFPLADDYPAELAAPLLCAGLIGYRSLNMTDGARRLGFYGFGSSAHILIQVALWQQREVYVFTRDGDRDGQSFARELGASWAGGSSDQPPERLDAAIIFAPVGELVVSALKASAKGAIIVCAGIHMSDIPSFPYSLLWEERQLRSVANLTRRDGAEFLDLAPRIPIQTRVTTFPLSEANQALEAVRQGDITGSAVLRITKPTENEPCV